MSGMNEKGSLSSASSLPIFLRKTYEMVDDPSSNTVVSWNENNKGFVILNPEVFIKDILPKYYEVENEIAYFLDNLRIFGFDREVRRGKVEYENDNFVRDQPGLMRKIQRNIALEEKINRRKEKTAKFFAEWYEETLKESQEPNLPSTWSFKNWISNLFR